MTLNVCSTFWLFFIEVSIMDFWIARFSAAWFFNLHLNDALQFFDDNVVGGIHILYCKANPVIHSFKKVRIGLMTYLCCLHVSNRDTYHSDIWFRWLSVCNYIWCFLILWINETPRPLSILLAAEQYKYFN